MACLFVGTPLVVGLKGNQQENNQFASPKKEQGRTFLVGLPRLAEGTLALLTTYDVVLTSDRDG